MATSTASRPINTHEAGLSTHSPPSTQTSPIWSDLTHTLHTPSTPTNSTTAADPLQKPRQTSYDLVISTFCQQEDLTIILPNPLTASASHAQQRGITTLGTVALRPRARLSSYLPSLLTGGHAAREPDVELGAYPSAAAGKGQANAGFQAARDGRDGGAGEHAEEGSTGFDGFWGWLFCWR